MTVPSRRWSYSLRTLFVVAGLLTVTLGVKVAIASELGDVLERNRLAWDKYLDENCSTGMSEQAVRKLMDKKYRDIGFARANPDIYRLLFLIDDYHQVEFAFHNNSKLLMTPNVERKGQWIRSPDGNTVSIPNPMEAALRAKIEAAAIQYVTKQTAYKAESLSAYGKRGPKLNNWIVVVTLNNLQVDSPNFVLEVTEDGLVEKFSSP